MDLKGWFDNIRKNEFTKVNLMEADALELNEITLDPNDSYQYYKLNKSKFTDGFGFEDRCGNVIHAIYIHGNSEFKTGFKLEGLENLVFKPENYPNEVIPCPDPRKLNTIYKVLVDEIIPKYLNIRGTKITFNPVSDSREKLVRIILNKIIKQYPHLKIRGKYLINI